MKVDYRTTLYKDDSIRMIEAVKHHFCCEQMGEALDDNFIGFGEFIDSILNQDTAVNIAVCHPWPEGAAWDFTQINFCPFCAAPIKTEQISK